jgi:hypothetical protein
MENKPTISGIVNTALRLVYTRRVEMLKSMLIPFALLSGLDYASEQEMSFALNITISLLSLATYTYFAVIIHRIVLLGPDSIQKWGVPAWSKRETYFFFHLFALILLSLIIIFLFAIIPQTGIFLGYIVLTYLFIRLSLVFPASAIDEGVTFKISWQMTKKHQIVMLYIAILLPLVLLLPAYFVAEISSIYLISSVIDTVAAVIGVSLLSVAYRQIKLYEYSS